MNIEFKKSTLNDVETISSLVIQLTQEICERTEEQHFNIDLDSTRANCQKLLSSEHYAAIIGWFNHTPVAMATIAKKRKSEKGDATLF